ncbi:hypothetical protein ACP70R_029125 [Stipagrostis hirtigluma subsp. patula]
MATPPCPLRTHYRSPRSERPAAHSGRLRSIDSCDLLEVVDHGGGGEQACSAASRCEGLHSSKQLVHAAALGYTVCAVQVDGQVASMLREAPRLVPDNLLLCASLVALDWGSTLVGGIGFLASSVHRGAYCSFFVPRATSAAQLLSVVHGPVMVWPLDITVANEPFVGLFTISLLHRLGLRNMHLTGSWDSSEDNSYSGLLVSSCNVLDNIEDGSGGRSGGDDIASSDRFDADERNDPLESAEKEVVSDRSPPLATQSSSWRKGISCDTTLQDSSIPGVYQALLRAWKAKASSSWACI